MSAPADFLGLLDERERADLEAIATPRRAPRGQAILSEGQVPDRVILLQRGYVKVVAAGADGQEVVLGCRGPRRTAPVGPGRRWKRPPVRCARCATCTGSRPDAARSRSRTSTRCVSVLSEKPHGSAPLI